MLFWPYSFGVVVLQPLSNMQNPLQQLMDLGLKVRCTRINDSYLHNLGMAFNDGEKEL